MNKVKNKAANHILSKESLPFLSAKQSEVFYKIKKLFFVKNIAKIHKKTLASVFFLKETPPRMFYGRFYET